MAQKTAHIYQLTSSKETLELKANAQIEVVESMEKRLKEFDKATRKLEEQKQKAVIETSVLKTQLDTTKMRFEEIEAENRNFK